MRPGALAVQYGYYFLVASFWLLPFYVAFTVFAFAQFVESANWHRVDTKLHAGNFFALFLLSAWSIALAIKTNVGPNLPFFEQGFFLLALTLAFVGLWLSRYLSEHEIDLRAGLARILSLAVLVFMSMLIFAFVADALGKMELPRWLSGNRQIKISGLPMVFTIQPGETWSGSRDSFTNAAPLDEKMKPGKNWRISQGREADARPLTAAELKKAEKLFGKINASFVPAKPIVRVKQEVAPEKIPEITEFEGLALSSLLPKSGAGFVTSEPTNPGRNTILAAVIPHTAGTTDLRGTLQIYSLYNRKTAAGLFARQPGTKMLSINGKKVERLIGPGVIVLRWTESRFAFEVSATGGGGESLKSVTAFASAIVEATIDQASNSLK